MSIRDGKLIYHLVPLDSLKSIIEHGLMSRDDLNNNKISYTDTANKDILQERKRLGLSQYIPFHFHIHTAYDTAVKNANPNIVFAYICLHRDSAKRENFKVLPIHPASNERPDLYDYNEGFEAIDWHTMELTNREAENEGIDSRYHKQVRMAECLAFSPVPVNRFFSINVPDEKAKEYVLNLLKSFDINCKLRVNVMDWFV
ncbi:MAG: DUF4433 domain-containing protein [Ruminococcus sp.]|nr:DUF4433 domain-containing protein [Ruminococcus sp.]